MATYRFPRMLTLLAWEAELRRGPYAAKEAWFRATSADRLNLDFSRVEFADIGALAGALLLLDAAVQLRIPAAVTLPTSSVFAADGRQRRNQVPAADPDPAAVGVEPTLAVRQARARGDARAFMRQVGFLDALRAPHWGKDAVQVLDRATARTQEPGSATGMPAPDPDPDPDPHNAPYRRRRVFPFRWLEPMPAVQFRESDSFLEVSAGLEDLGLSQSEARTVSQTILTELVENVPEHGRTSHRPPVALVGAILLSAETYMFRQDGMYPHMADVAERAMVDGNLVLRLIVADSGADLAARPAPIYGQRSDEAESSPVSRREETALSAPGKPPAMMAEGMGVPRGTTGLWWVERVARSYRGGIQARTGDLLAGVMFGRVPDGTRVVEAGLGHIPGTVLELAIPTGPRPRRPRVLWGSQPAPGTVAQLQWVKCAFDPHRGLSDADRAQLADLAHAPRPDGQPTGLVVTIPVSDLGHAEADDGWRGAIQRALGFISSMAGSAAVVVVFPDAEPHMLDPCLAAFNEELADSGEDEHDPIVALGCRGDPVWCGGTAPLRAVLNSLSGNGGMTSLAAARKCWLQAGGEPARFPGAIRAHDHLLSSTSRRLGLRLSPSAVHETLERAASQDLTRAIDEGTDGVELGRFRGPTLRITSRWVDVEQLLAGTVGVQVAGFALARMVEAALRASPTPEAPTGVLRVTSAPRPLARHLSECLSLGPRYYSQPSELDIGEPPTGERVPAGTKVVLCTDLISTENTVRRAAATVAGGGAEPLVIACVIDARDRPGPVKVLNRTIPVVSLTQVEIGVNGAADQRPVTDIDPLLLRPEVAPVPARMTPVQESDLFRWFGADPDVLRLGHIDDPPHRHYSAFIKLQALREQEIRNQITAAVLSNIRQAFAEIRTQASPDLTAESPIAIWYVASDGNAGRLADIVGDFLTVEGIDVSAVTPIPRLPAGDSWAFPTRIRQVNRPMAVVIIHWWAITGSTLLQLIRLAAESGASSIAAVCMFNQLESNDADVLLMLRAVSVPMADAENGNTPSVGDSQPTALTPVAIRFVAGSPITAFDEHACPMCATRDRRYPPEDEDAPPRLARHADLLRDVLRPRDLEEVSRDSAADLFNVPVTSDEATDYLRWRALLTRARREVRTRQEVISRLRSLTGEPPSAPEWTTVGLIRLLAAEQQWLRLPPLHLELAKGLLLQVCVRGLEQLTAPPWLRVQALMVMSVTAPEWLVERLPGLLASVGNEAVLVDQLLLDCRRLLLRPGDSPVDIVRLRHSLMECRDYLEERRSGPDAAADDHLHAVLDLITIADYRILRKPKDAQAAWERLREDLVRPVVRHRLEAELLLVRNFVEDIEQVNPSPEDARRARVDWDTSARQLEERALANLPPLRDILAGDFVSDRMGRRDQRRLLTLARLDVGELRAVANRLHQLAHGSWRPDDPSWQALRRELLDRINWWNRMFLAAHIPDHHEPALLVELIRSAPVRLGPLVERLLVSYQAQATIAQPEDGDVNVFCPEKLLDQIVVHLIENVSKHRLANTVCRLNVEYKRSAEERIELVVRNSGTRARTPEGQGIRALNDKLRPFGGSLEGHVLAEDEWTFAAIVTLPVWHGG
jgi:adenine/guanine phosphoribosyltransferase-like PRPP-binding protein/signal transduction histidine kinase